MDKQLTIAIAAAQNGTASPEQIALVRRELEKFLGAKTAPVEDKIALAKKVQELVHPYMVKMAAVDTVAVKTKVEDRMIDAGLGALTVGKAVAKITTTVAVAGAEIALVGTSILAGSVIGAGAKLLAFGAKKLLK